MKLKLKETPEQVELIKALGSKNPTEAAQAAEAFAAFIAPVAQKVLMQAGTAGMIFQDSVYDEDDNPSIPLDLFYDAGTDFVSVWSQGVAGGLPTSQVSGLQELKIATYRLDSAVSFLKRYARRGRLDVVGKSVERMAQEVLVKQERNAWAVILKALAEASTNGLSHMVGAGATSSFVPGDMSALLTRAKRINTSWANGTPADFDSKGVTDMYVSPEVMGYVRGFAYNPVNTTGSLSNGAVALPYTIREEIFKAAGMQEIFGIVLHELLELGVGKKYNTLVSEFIAGASSGTGVGPAGGNWDDSTDEMLVGIDASRDAFIRPVARQDEGGATFTALPDDQFVARQEKTGFYGYLEEGRVCIDSRAVVGLVVHP
tara:strand:- start:299 stop:1417 length:1119 start_codon:yes stop_codon:yes gene_type:complete